MKKIISAALAALLLLFCAVPVFAAEHATLYIGDAKWESDSILPFIESGGKMLVPAIAFAEFDGLAVSQSDTLGSLLIEGEDKYLSYNLNFGTRLDEGGNVTECDIFRYGGQIYLEPDAVCEKFGLKFETAYAPDGYLTARLTDGSETADFNTLLSSHADDAGTVVPYLYNPTGKTAAGSFVHPILLNPSVTNVEEAIGILGKNGVSFAISPAEIKQYAETVSKIYANGHTLVYYMDGAVDKALFKEQMDEANEYLFSLVGKTNRIYISTERYEKIPEIDGYFAKSCRLHLVVNDLVSDRMINTAFYEAPLSGSYNFSLASDKATRGYYSYFFRKLSAYKTLRSVPLKESSSIK
ncbi:MAG: hypothetical protein IJ002_02130 [Clostridia bacterium]|nr:hypothetical protein [Clostridia bacterium]